MKRCEDLNIELCPGCVFNKLSGHSGHYRPPTHSTSGCWVVFYSAYGDLLDFKNAALCLISEHYGLTTFYFYQAIKHYHPHLLPTLDKLMVLL